MKTTEFKYLVHSNDFLNAGNVSQQIKKALMQLDIPNEIIRRVVLAVYEGEINMIIHANGGIIEVFIDEDKIKMVLSDNGPGIPDIELAKQSGFSTVSDNDEIRTKGFGAGKGFTNMQKFSDTFEVESVVGLGTTITMTVNLSED